MIYSFCSIHRTFISFGVEFGRTSLMDNGSFVHVPAKVCLLNCGYVNDGRPFWQYIVSSSTGCSDSQYFEELYNYYTTEKAWHICDPDAEKVFKTPRNAGVKLAVVSNFDTRLRPVFRALNCDYWFDVVAVSAEVEAEKPNPTIFIKACCSKDRSLGLNRTIPFQQLDEGFLSLYI
ncbi:hypothetical protein ACSBR2_020215 [Camellia fascicularis]